jgi:WD40 repeat protein
MDLVKNLVGLVYLLLMVPQATQADLLGVSWGGSVFRINESSGNAESLFTTDFAYNSLAVNSHGHYYATGATRDTDRLFRIDARGDFLISIKLSLSDFRALAFAPNDQLFATRTAIRESGLGSQLVTIDPSTGFVKQLGSPLDLAIVGLAFSPDGALYGWDVGPRGRSTGIGLVRLATDGTSFTDVNPLVGAPGSDIQALEFSPEGILFGGRSRLFTINPSTGVYTSVGDEYRWDVRGLAYIPRIPEPSSWLLMIVACCRLQQIRRKRVMTRCSA